MKIFHGLDDAVQILRRTLAVVITEGSVLFHRRGYVPKSAHLSKKILLLSQFCMEFAKILL